MHGSLRVPIFLREVYLLRLSDQVGDRVESPKTIGEPSSPCETPRTDNEGYLLVFRCSSTIFAKFVLKETAKLFVNSVTVHFFIISLCYNSLPLDIHISLY